MLIIFGLSIISLICTLYLYNKINDIINQLKKLAVNFNAKYTNEHWIISYIRAMYLKFRCMCLTLYHDYTSITTKKYNYVKYVHGGKIYINIIKNKNGPKPFLEYAYIDNVRMDELFTMLLGINREFSCNKEALFEFGSIIRYKFINEEEIELISSGIENEKKIENLKKIKKLVRIS